jgi:hypothetical protein
MFASTGECAFVDFQYVGSGVPTLDLIYFLGTSAKPSLLRGEGSNDLLRLYHATLIDGLKARGMEDVYPWDTLQWHWELAVVDWFRFMAGWGMWGNHRWVSELAREIVDKWNRDGFEHR